MFWALTRQRCGAEEKLTASDPPSPQPPPCMLQGPVRPGFSNCKGPSPCSMANLLTLFRFPYGTLIALFTGACWDFVQENVV
jgi:hypothetical protein